MNLLEHQLEPYLQGVLRTEATERGVLFHRLTEAQVTYVSRQPVFAAFARSPAGVRIGLVTNSTFVDVTLSVPPADATVPNVALDVEVDGVVTTRSQPVPAGGAASFAQRLFEAPRDADEGLYREVCLYLPYHRPLVLERLDVDDHATVDPLPKPGRRLLMLGDSITQGAFASSGFASMATQLGRLLDMELLNQGLGGHMFDEQFVDVRLHFNPDVVVVAYGTNDWSVRTREQEQRHVSAFVGRVRRTFSPQRTAVVVVTPLWRHDGGRLGPGGTLADFSTGIAEAAAAVGGVQIIDGLRLVPQRGEYFSDGVHLNDTGSSLCAAGLFCEMRKAGIV
jgi:lysophospholipase L1-like esterase